MTSLSASVVTSANTLSLLLLLLQQCPCMTSKTDKLTDGDETARSVCIIRLCDTTDCFVVVDIILLTNYVGHSTVSVKDFTRYRGKICVGSYRTLMKRICTTCFVGYCVKSEKNVRIMQWRVLVLPRHRLQTYGRRTFSVAGPSTWNSLPDNLRDSSVSKDSFCKLLKSYLFTLY